MRIAARDMQKLAEARNTQLRNRQQFRQSPFMASRWIRRPSAANRRGLVRAETALIAYMEKNKDWCSFPDEAISQLKEHHAEEYRVQRQGLHGRGADEKDEGASGSGRRRGPASSAAACRTSLTAAPQPAASLPDARPASLVLRLTPDFALPFVQLARLDRPTGWQLLLAPCWQATALAGLALHRGPEPLASRSVSDRRDRHARRRLHLQRHSRPQTRRWGRAHAQSSRCRRAG